MDKYINYIKVLDEKNIILYDFQKRITFHRLNNLQLDQIGGGINQIKLSDFDNYKLEKIIFSLLDNNIEFVKDYIKKSMSQ